MRLSKIIMLFLCILHCIDIRAQKSVYNFHKLGLDEGLHDGTIRCIGQDKYGYIWIGSVGALNRYDGKKVNIYSHQKGSTSSPYGSKPTSICSDSMGRLWFGFETGLLEFDFAKNTFSRVGIFDKKQVNSIICVSDSILFLGTSQGLVRYNCQQNVAFYYNKSSLEKHHNLASQNISDLSLRRNKLYIAGEDGLIVLDLTTDELIKIDVPGLNLSSTYKVAIDDKSNIWLGTDGENKLIKISSDKKSFKVYDSFLTESIYTQDRNVTGIVSASNHKIWVATYLDGLLEYDETQDIFTRHVHNKFLPSSPSNNNHFCIFEDSDGLIWLGGDIDGVHYFKPEKNLFQTIFPFPDRLDEEQRSMGLAYATDKDGNIWMSSESGLTMYKPSSEKYTIWQNREDKRRVVYKNLTLSLLCDDENSIWIGTSSGVNRYNSNHETMEFISEKQLPLSRYFCIYKDRSSKIWFGTNSEIPLYWYDIKTKTYNNISNHKVLRQIIGLGPVNSVFEDSKGRLWVSIYNNGLIMHDTTKQEIKRYLASDDNKLGIIGNMIRDIKEDKKGVIWVSTPNGITGIDVENNKFLSFNNQTGLLTNIVEPIAVDDADRLWMGVSGGIMMLSPSRDHFTLFTKIDGASSLEFSGRPSFQSKNGIIVFPSNNGYIHFNPKYFVDAPQRLKFYVHSYSILNKEFNFLKDENVQQKLNFRSDESSFTLNLTALNFENPSRTWFAYKLDDFEDDWHYTQDAKAVYTNVPGGDYTFLFKATTDNHSWDAIDAKKVYIHLDTYFYKSSWFAVSMLLLFVSMVVGVFRFRANQLQQLYQLRSKAQSLEKEKAMVMYENLKQHLNPHFLFNSLTSLSSLIRFDQKQAVDFLDKMSKVYRYILKNKDNETVSLGEELRFIDMYIQLQKTRFNNGLEVKMDIPETLHHRKIAPVTLQNLLENAIKHNIADDDSPLIIQFYIEEDYLIVQNNLQKKNFVETSNKQGQASMVSLYRYLSSKPVIIEETDDFYTVKIPLI